MDKPHNNSGNMLKVAAIQMVSTPDVNENLAHAGNLIEKAALEGAKLVALPEYFCFMGHQDRDKLTIAETEGDGPIQHFLTECAIKHGIWLVGGTLALTSPDPDRVFNTSFVYSPLGKQIGRYDKIHLFGFARGNESYDESISIRPGDLVRCVDLPGARVGLSVCYDLRFPELYQALGAVDLILVPSAFTYTTGRAHWELLLRARAIENQCYVLAPAQGGTHPNGRRTWGHSMLIDPWGEIVDVLDEGPGVVGGTIDLSRIADVRASLPALRHRVL